MFAAGNAVIAWANAIVQTSLHPDTLSQQPLKDMPEQLMVLQNSMCNAGSPEWAQLSREKAHPAPDKPISSLSHSWVYQSACAVWELEWIKNYSTRYVGHLQLPFPFHVEVSKKTAYCIKIIISLFSLWGCFHFRALLPAVRQQCSLPHPLSSTIGGWLCDFQLRFLAVPPATHQPCPPEPERTEAAAFPISEWGSAHPN